MRRNFTPEQDATIAAEYAAGSSGYALAAKYGGNRIAILQAVRRAGGRIRTFKESNRANVLALVEKQRRFSDDEEKLMAAEYAAGYSTTDIGKRWGCDPTLAWKAIRRAGGTLRRRTRTHSLNEAAFDNALDSESASYYAGLLFADGCVSVRLKGTAISLGLSGDDGVMVYRFREFLGSTHAICESTPVTPFSTNAQKKSEVSIVSDRLANALYQYGIMPRKSLTAVVRGGMECNRHFVRGWCDGDGWLGVSAKGVPFWGITGSKASMVQVGKLAQQVTGLRPAVGKNGTVWRVVFTGRRAVQMTRHLYADCTVAMPRKLAIARRILSR